MNESKSSLSTRKITKVVDGKEARQFEDVLTGEEPLAIIIHYEKKGALVEFPLSITMRTPGADEALVSGFLLTEGIIDSPGQIASIESDGMSGNALLRDQTIRVTLKKGFAFDEDQFNRNFYASSSCGVCGKNSIDQLEKHILTVLPQGSPRVSVETVVQLNEKMRSNQQLFHQTGGIHGTAVFDSSGNLQFLEEDVGRHNAMDKVIGQLMRRDALPAMESIVSVSGRAGFELVQKALIAGFPIMTAVGAPSDLAADLADAYGMTLIGFLKGKQFNIYTHPQRILF